MNPARTVGMLALLTAALPVTAAVTAAALLTGRPVPPRPSGRTVLLSGGKMTKALTLARAFHAAGHRVVLVEQARYRLTGHRFSRAVDAFHVVPAPDDPGYADALLDVVRAEGVDVYVPVCSPVASLADALAKTTLAPHCEVLHPDPDVLRLVDDKYSFFSFATSLGLAVPDTHRITDSAQVAAFDFTARPGPYVLKSLAYDPVRRLDLTPLPRPTPEQTAAFAATLPISSDNPWILQELLTGQEYCTHGTVRDGRLTVFCCCESSASQLNYAAVDKPAVEAWVRTFTEALGATGQLSFDLMEDTEGTVRGIECNPRTHSAITLFDGHPDLAAAYLDGTGATVVPRPDARPTHWTYQELWRLLTQPGRRARLAGLAAGTDAMFSWRDPLPFLAVHHLSIPALLLGNLVAGRPWVKIDLNIGKLVEPGGD